MAASRISTRFQLLRPWWVKALAGAAGAIGLYDIGCNQFGWPKIPELWGMTGSLLPLWGWLFILQALVLYALFEYVRRNVGPAPSSTENTAQGSISGAEAARRIEALQGELANINAIIEKLQPILAERREKLKQETVEMLERQKKAWPRAAGHVPVRTRFKTQLLYPFLRETGAKIDIGTLDKVRQQIEGNSLYSSLQPGEEGFWSSGQEKQKWHAFQAEIDALIAAVKAS